MRSPTAHTPTQGAQLLRQTAVARGWCQRMLAKRLHISPQQVSHYIQGSSRPPLDRAVEMEDALGIPVRSWLRPGEKPT